MSNEMQHFTPGHYVEALDEKRNWRPAVIQKDRPLGQRGPGGANILWRDVNPFDQTQSAGGWKSQHAIRPVADQAEAQRAYFERQAEWLAARKGHRTR